MKNLAINYRELRDICLAPISALVADKDAYTFIDNKAHILAVAHCDYVSHGAVDFVDYPYKGSHYILSETLDDRLGVYLITKLLPSLHVKVDVLLTKDEEIGKSTASEFVLPTGKEYNWIFSFDRRGTDIVAYDYDDDDLEDVVKASTGKSLAYGSFSDIVELEHLGVKGLNFGTGYYNEHTETCNATENSIRKAMGTFIAFYNANKKTKLPHTPTVWSRHNGYYYRDDDYDYNSRFISTATRTVSKVKVQGIESNSKVYGECGYCGEYGYNQYYVPLSSYICENCYNVIADELARAAIVKKPAESKPASNKLMCEYCTTLDNVLYRVNVLGTEYDLCDYCRKYVMAHIDDKEFMKTLVFNKEVIQ